MIWTLEWHDFFHHKNRLNHNHQLISAPAEYLLEGTTHLFLDDVITTFTYSFGVNSSSLLRRCIHYIHLLGKQKFDVSQSHGHQCFTISCDLTFCCSVSILGLYTIWLGHHIFVILAHPNNQTLVPHVGICSWRACIIVVEAITDGIIHLLDINHKIGTWLTPSNLRGKTRRQPGTTLCNSTWIQSIFVVHRNHAKPWLR